MAPMKRSASLLFLLSLWTTSTAAAVVAVQSTSTDHHAHRGVTVGFGSDCAFLFRPAPRHTTTTATTTTIFLGGGDGSVTVPATTDRRMFIVSTAAAASAVAVGGGPRDANAATTRAKGAAEYDLEYYLRDLVMGNKKEGNLPASNAPPAHPPRTLSGPLLPLLLGDDDDNLSSTIAVKELVRIVAIKEGRSQDDELSNRLVQSIRDVRNSARSAFAARYPIRDDSLKDQYYFDLSAYALWRVAAAVTGTDYALRDDYVRTVGRAIYGEMLERGLLDDNGSNKNNNNNSPLTGSIPAIIKVLDLYQSSGFISGYRLGEKNDEVRQGPNVFDELDDKEITGGGSGMVGSVDCLISVFDPATLGAALQITGEGSRFAPDFVGPTLAAIWEGGNGNGGGALNKNPMGGSGRGSGLVSASWESYFVDPVYRPNPKDFFPDERLYQFTLKRRVTGDNNKDKR